MSTDVQKFLGDLDGGMFEQKLSTALSEVAQGVVNNGKKGTVTVELTLARIGESNQVQIKHALKYAKPTRRGKSTEVDTTETPMHVARGGAMTIFPINQGQLDLGQTHQQERV